MADNLPELNFGDELPDLDFGDGLPDLDFGDTADSLPELKFEAPPRQYSPDQLAAESERQRTGKRKLFDVGPSKDDVIGESKAFAKDLALGAAGAAKSVVPFMDRRSNPAFGERGTAATAGNVAVGFVRGAATQALGTALTRNKLGGSIALAADRALQIGREEGWDTFREHPIATATDVALSAVPGAAPSFQTGVRGILKPLAIDAATGAGQGGASAIHQGADLSTEEGRAIAAKEALIGGATAAGVTTAKTALPGLLNPKRKAVSSDVVLQPGAKGQAGGRPGQVSSQAGEPPTGVESQVIRSSPEPESTPAQGAADDPVSRVRSKIVMENQADTRSLGAKAKDVGNQLLTDVFDEKRPFLLADRAAKKLGAELGPRQESYKSMRGLQRRIVSKATSLANRGWVDDDTGEVLSPSLREVFSGLKPDRMADFATYLVARRAPEMSAKQQKLPFSLYDAEQSVKALDSEFRETADKYDSVMSGALDYAQKKGFFSPEQIKAIRDENMFYVPWERVDDAGNIVQSVPTGGNKKMFSNPLKKATSEGSERSIANPLETSVGNLTRLISAVEKNESKRVFADLADIGGMDEWVKPIKGTPKDFAMKAGNVIELRRNGETQSYQVHPEVAKTLGALNAQENAALASVLKFQADLQRSGVVFDPSFAINNLLRDAWQQAAVSRSTSIPFANQARGLAMLTTKSGRDMWREWKSGAGNQSIEYGAIFNPEEVLKSIGEVDPARSALMRSVRKPITAINTIVSAAKNIMSAAESVGRAGEYGRVKSKSIRGGASEADARAEAEFQSADLLDFGMGGRSRGIKELRKYVPFFGANLSGMYREGAVMRNPVKLVKAIGVLGGMEALNYVANQEDPEYWNEPNWKRFAFWRIPTKEWFGWKENVWLPKPPGLLNYGITAPIKTGLEGLHQKDQEAAAKNANELLRSLGVGVIPPAPRTIMELGRGDHGFSDFMDREIVPKKLQGLPARMQYTGRTTEVAKAASRLGEKAGISISPVKFDYGVQGMAGPLAKRGVEALDPLFSGTIKPRGEGVVASVMKRNFAQPGSFGSEVQTRFFEKLDRLEQESRAAKVGQGVGIDTSRVGAMRAANEEASKLRAIAASATSEPQRLAIMRKIDALYAPFVDMPSAYRP